MPTLLEQLNLKPVYNDNTYSVRCHNCGKFISRIDIENQKAKFHFIPDSQFGPEESYWEHTNC